MNSIAETFNTMDVSSNIKSIRAANGLSQAEVARRLELDPSAYFRLENRGNKLSIEQVESIAKALGVTVLDLLTWGTEKVQPSEQLDVGRLERDLAKSDELLKYQREKINYLQATCTELIVEMAFAGYDVDGKIVIKENPDNGESDFTYPEDDWRQFLADFLVSDDWAFELLERGVTDEKTVMNFDIENESSVPVPRDIKRKQRKRLVARLKNIRDSPIQ